MYEPSRQIHLDFHTSEHIGDIGGRFRKEQFQEALKLGRINLINIFAKCHHSWSYYPTQVGNPHPHLQIDLLGQQIEACHEIGVKCPIYYTMGWSAHDAETHPEWCMREPDGTVVVNAVDVNAEADDPRPAGSWKFLCPSGDYHALMRAQTDEICRLYPVDGFWYDIYIASRLCYCDNCRKGMRDASLDSNIVEDVRRFRAQTLRSHAEDLKRVILSYHPDASIYFNGLTTHDILENITFHLYDMNTKNDLEDLPTTWGGYDKFPVRSRFFLKEGKPVVAMSGKFHTSWGEFGGFKHPDALRYEAAAMIAFGARCNFGDQLHPSGEMDLGTYGNIGKAYEYIEQIEAYGLDGQPAANLGIWFSNTVACDEGTARMLLEQQIDFDLVVARDDLSRFEVIILPSGTRLSGADAEKLKAYCAAGGKVLALGAGALDGERKAFALDVGATYIGAAHFDCDYTIVHDTLAEGLVRTPFLNYQPGLRVEAGKGTAVLAAVREPYFSRTYGRYCSHQNTPYQLEDAPHPGVIQNGTLLYSAHPLDTMYYHHGARVHRQLFINMLRILHNNPVLQVEMPSSGRVSLLHQPDTRRYVAHLLYAPPLQRGNCLVIEDLVPLRRVPVQLRLGKTVRKITLIPDNTELPWQEKEGVVTTTVPEFTCHCAVVVEYNA